jgi:hypothetical protein
MRPITSCPGTTGVIAKQVQDTDDVAVTHSARLNRYPDLPDARVTKRAFNEFKRAVGRGQNRLIGVLISIVVCAEAGFSITGGRM